MKILLINPPRWNELVGKNPSIIEKHRGFNPPLGLLYIASALKKFSSHEVQVIDTQPLKWTYAQLEDHLKEKDFDVAGISVMTFTLLDGYTTAKLIKKIRPETKVVLGGTHVHLYPDETESLSGVDFAFMGEAEFSFIKFVNNLSSPENFPSIPGLVFKQGDGKIIKNDFGPVVDLDDVPFPKRDLLDIRLYNSLLGRRSLNTTIISSRGCPFRCAFCDRPLSPITSRFRSRSAKNVVDEMCECMELGIKDFLFYDDTFTVNKKRVMDICEEIMARKIRVRWDMRTRIDTVDDDMLRALKNAGCQAIHYGVEAGNDRILKIIKKGFTISKIRETFKSTKNAGLETLAYFMIGLPSENIDDIQDSFSLAKELKPDYAHFTIFSPYPGTELYSLGLERGIIKKDIWREFAVNPNKDFKIPVWEEVFTREQLYELIVKFYKSFYLRPRYLLERIQKLRSWDEFGKKARAGLSVLTMKKEDVDQIK